MLPVPTRAYLVSGPVDMRNAIDGLALLVEALLGRSPFSGEVFVFFNRGADKVKLLWWDPYHLSLLENARHSEQIGVTGAPRNLGNILDSVIHWNDGKK